MNTREKIARRSSSYRELEVHHFKGSFKPCLRRLIVPGGDADAEVGRSVSCIIAVGGLLPR
jgi:hypothetical protein